MDVGEDTTLGDSDVTKELVQFFIVADGELEMSWDDTSLLVITGSVTSQLEDFGRKILKDSGEVNWRTSTDTLSIVAFSEESVDTTNRESKPSL